VQFAGNIEDKLLELKNKYKKKNIELLGYLPYSETVQLTMRANVLLLLINNIPRAEGVITSKIFGYIASGNFILGYGPSGGEASDILKQSSAGIMVDFDDMYTMRDTILKLYDRWLKKRPVNENFNENNSKMFSRKKITQELINIFENL
jgi:glycosyltransferase involved in cell wall biosynthesis